jgi:hypothetical protein
MNKTLFPLRQQQQRHQCARAQTPSPCTQTPTTAPHAAATQGASSTLSARMPETPDIVDISTCLARSSSLEEAAHSACKRQGG